MNEWWRVDWDEELSARVNDDYLQPSWNGHQGVLDGIRHSWDNYWSIDLGDTIVAIGEGEEDRRYISFFMKEKPP